MITIKITLPELSIKFLRLIEFLDIQEIEHEIIPQPEEIRFDIIVSPNGQFHVTNTVPDENPIK